MASIYGNGEEMADRIDREIEADIARPPRDLPKPEQLLRGQQLAGESTAAGRARFMPAEEDEDEKNLEEHEFGEYHHFLNNDPSRAPTRAEDDDDGNRPTPRLTSAVNGDKSLQSRDRPKRGGRDNDNAEDSDWGSMTEDRFDPNADDHPYRERKLMPEWAQDMTRDLRGDARRYVNVDWHTMEELMRGADRRIIHEDEPVPDGQLDEWVMDKDAIPFINGSPTKLAKKYCHLPVFCHAAVL
jgi:hypothetical protein